MSGILSLDELKALAEKGEVETVICAIPDHWGRLVGKRLRVKTFFDVALSDEGLHGSLFLLCVDMEMEPREGYALTGWGDGFPDFRFAPDLDTLRLVPWQEKTALVICDACQEDTDELVEVAPRSILKRQIARAAERDLSIKCATELEFYLYKATVDEAWKARYEDLEPASRYRSDYHIFQGTLMEGFARDVREHLAAAGVEIEFSKPEWGLGQQEINTRYSDALTMADRHVIFKMGVKEIAAKHGFIATFMAKPYVDDVGSSCHIHASLWDKEGKTPIGWDAEAPNHFSETFNHFLGGSMAATKDLAVTLAPTVNSYKRIQPESFAPTGIAVGIDNRTCSHRIVGHEAGFRFENRIPGADVHPHIALSSILAAGIHGIDNAIPAPEPLAENAYEVPSLERVAQTFTEAIGHFRDSSIAQEAYGDTAFRHLLNFYHTENDDFQRQSVTDWERARYFERI